MANLEVGDLVLCTVDRIVGTVVFVKIEGNIERFHDVASKTRSGVEGSIIVSEIAPGRIRNLRDYVVPKKKIVCKVLRISGDRIDLSLRRVSLKEQKEVLEQYSQEKSYKSLLKSVLGEKADLIIEEITKQRGLYEFLEEAKSSSKELEAFVGKNNAQKILSILKTQKQKKSVIKKEFNLKSKKPDGLTAIKEILGNIKGAEVKYLSAGKYYLKTEATDPKTSDNLLRGILEEIEKQAKKQGLDFSIKEK